MQREESNEFTWTLESSSDGVAELYPDNLKWLNTGEGVDPDSGSVVVQAENLYVCYRGKRLFKIAKVGDKFIPV